MKFCCLLLVLLPSFAWAAQPSPIPSPPELRYAKKTLLDFSELAVTGEVTRPAGDFLTARKKARFSSLIRLRNTFQSELEVSVDRL